MYQKGLALPNPGGDSHVKGCACRCASCQQPLQALAAKGAEKTFLERFAEKRQNREAAVYVAKTLQQVKRDGIARSLAIGRIRRLKGNVVEVKVQGTVVRCLAYWKPAGSCLCCSPSSGPIKVPATCIV